MASKDSEVIPESCESRDVFCIHTATVSLPFPLRHLPRVCRGFGNSVNPRHTSLPQLPVSYIYLWEPWVQYLSLNTYLVFLKC